MRECKFRAMVELDPSARAVAVRRLLDRTHPQCVLQPCDGKWFPAAVSVGGAPSQGRPVHTVVRVRLLAGEPEAFFATGQPFTLWADAIVDDQTVRGEGRLGDGFILSQGSPLPTRPLGQQPARRSRTAGRSRGRAEVRAPRLWQGDNDPVAHAH